MFINSRSYKIEMMYGYFYFYFAKEKMTIKWMKFTILNCEGEDCATIIGRNNNEDNK